MNPCKKARQRALNLVILTILSLSLVLAGCANTEISGNPTDSFATPLPTSTTSVTSGDRVDVIYFHRAQRCKTCVCFEERITQVVQEHFQEQLKNGSLNYRVLNLEDKTNATLVKKYGSVSSQLFINIVLDGSEYFEDIQDIWSWNCTGDIDGFDAKVSQVIEQSLGAIQ